MAYMVSILCVATLLGVVLHQPPAADAFTCYDCSTSPSGCSCCGSEIGSAPTCEGGACATVFYPDGNVTRMCDPNVRHGCNQVGENEVCGCHENYCNTDICRVQDNCTASTAASTFFPSSSTSQVRNQKPVIARFACLLMDHPTALQCLYNHQTLLFHWNPFIFRSNDRCCDNVRIQRDIDLVGFYSRRREYIHLAQEQVML